MRKIFLIFLILSFYFSTDARAQSSPDGTPAAAAAVSPFPVPTSIQHPVVRPKPPDDPNAESSSFIGDSENLDPLRARRENLKEDNEPVLDDIKQVLDAPAPVAEKPADFAPSIDQAAAGAPAKKKSAKKSAVAKKKSVSAKKAAQPRKLKAIIVRNADDPDQRMEKRFYENYMRYNADPTSTEQWSAATFGRSSEVYIVQKGDTLWTISETLFGDSLFWPKIWALNRQGIVNPHYILPGMRIQFYPGSEQDVPTLAVGENGLPVGSQTAIDSQLSQDQNFDDADDYASADDHFPVTEESSSGAQGRSKRRSVSRLNAKDRATPLPPSLPIYRSELYFGQPRKVEIIDLAAPEKLPVTLSTDIFLADRMVLNDIKISDAVNNALGCFPGQMIEGFQYIRKTPTNEYTILQPLDKVTLSKDVYLYPYRRVGTVAHYNEKLKIKECNDLLSSTQVFVPTSILNSLKARKQSQATPQILGGPINETHFYISQQVYLDMGAMNFEPGQIIGVKSNRIDESAGKIKIIDRFGSYALGIIVDESNPIRVGDPLIAPAGTQ